MRDYYGYRKKFAVLVPSTNTAVETEYHRMCPEGVVLATRACVIPPFSVKTEEDFVNMVKAIGAATEQGLRDALTCQPDHVIFGYSAETFWDGKERSDREFQKYNAIAQQAGGCNITFGAQAILDALACYPKIKRLGVISPYMPVGDQQVVKFLADIGYEVVHIKGHRSDSPVTIAHESYAKTRELVRQVDGEGVDAILQAGVAGRVGADKVVERQRGRVGQDDPVPHHLHAALSVADLAVVAPEDARPLRNQQELAGGCVIDRLRHSADHVARQVRLDTRHQRTGDHRSRHHLIRRRRQRQVAGIAGFRRTGFQECLFLILPVLHGGRVGGLGRRRGRPSSERIEGRKRTCSPRRCLRDRGGGLPLAARAEEHRRGRRRVRLLAQGIFGIMAWRRIARRHRLLRSDDGRAKVAGQRRPQLGHIGR